MDCVAAAAAVPGLQAAVDLSRSGNSSYRLLFISPRREAALFLEADLAVHALSVCSGSWVPRAGRSKETPETNPDNEADSRASRESCQISE